MVRIRQALLGLVLTTGLSNATFAAPLTEDQFNIRTAGDFAALCSADRADPMMTAAVNFCHGFAVGVYQALNEEQAPHARKWFCMPNPPPTRTAAISDFVAMVNASPDLQARKPADAIFYALTQKYPCPAH
jgi:hypothetical protein